MRSFSDPQADSRGVKGQQPTHMMQLADSDALQGPWNPKSPAHLHWRLVRQAHNSRSSLGLNPTYQLSTTHNHWLFFTATLPDRQRFQNRESVWGSQVAPQCLPDKVGLVKHTAQVKETHLSALLQMGSTRRCKEEITALIVQTISK